MRHYTAIHANDLILFEDNVYNVGREVGQRISLPFYICRLDAQICMESSIIAHTIKITTQIARGMEESVIPTTAIPPPREDRLPLIPNINPIRFKIKEVIITCFCSEENNVLNLSAVPKLLNMYRKVRIPSEPNRREATACPCLFTTVFGAGGDWLATGLLADVSFGRVFFT